MNGIRGNIGRLALFNFVTSFRLYASVQVIFFASITGNWMRAMTVVSIIPLTSALFELPTGIFSDLVGRKITLVAGALSNVAGILLWAVFPDFGGFAAGSVFMGIASALFSGNNEALLFDTLENCDLRKEYHDFLGKISTPEQLALAINSLLGALLAAVSFRMVLWLSVLPQVIAFLIAVTLVPTPVKAGKVTAIGHFTTALRKTAGNRKLLMLSVTGGYYIGLSEASYELGTAFINLFWPLGGVGAARMLSNVLAAVSFYFSGPMIRKFGRFRLLMISTLYGRAAATGAVLLSNVISPILFTSPSLLFGTMMVANGSLQQDHFSEEERATMGSVSSMIGKLLFFALSILTGFLADRLSVKSALLVVQLLMLYPILAYMRLYRNAEQSLIT